MFQCSFTDKREQVGNKIFIYNKWGKSEIEENRLFFVATFISNLRKTLYFVNFS